MVLWIAEHGPLGDTAASIMSEAQTPCLAALPSDDDLFARAMGAKGIVYLPAPRLLDGLLEPKPDPQRARAVVGASRAPGVEVIVLVVPRSAGYISEEEVLQREGRPYLILRTPLLFEEAADALRRDTGRSIWLPRSGSVTVTSARAAVEAIMQALDTEEQGRVVEVPGEHIDVANLFRRAAGLGAPTRIHAVTPTLHRWARPVVRAVLGREPATLALADRLIAAGA